jgi:nicotinamidase-related amidase
MIWRLAMDTQPLAQHSAPFLAFVDQWMAGLRPLALDQLAAAPGQTALVSVDVINGFCHKGPLASPRVEAIIAPIVALMRRSWDSGIHHQLLIQDTHEPSAVEFAAYPPHCLRGSEESEAVPEIKALPFFEHMTVFPKNSIHSALNTGLPDWMAAHPHVECYIVVGDCTDLCTYQLAMHLRLEANSRQLNRRVVVPADCVDTYDFPIEAAAQSGGFPHDARLFHQVFLYSMALNGIEVVARLS